MLSRETILRPPPAGTWVKNLLELAPKAKVQKLLKSLSDQEITALKSEWVFNARAGQYAPEGKWSLWIIKAGRGYGKTKAGAEWVKDNALKHNVRRQALVAATNSDLRKVMIEGESGILAVCPEAKYSPQRQTVFFPNGAIAEGFSAEEPNRLRGPQSEKAWCDETAAWKYDQETWDNLQFGLRLGDAPQTLVTTTPKPRPLFKELLKKADHVTGGATFENKDNLARAFIEKIKEDYEGTRLGRQELYAEVLEDVEGALWTRDLFNFQEAGELVRVVIAIDPAVTSTEQSDAVGIVAAGKGYDGNGYILGDYSCRVSPKQWASRAVNAYHAHNADLIVAEANNGGDLIETVIKTVDERVPFKKVHASRGKRTRAEPISSLYEQGRIFHEKNFDKLEDEMCNWVPDLGMPSPDRMDAAVWALTELMLTHQPDYAVA